MRMNILNFMLGMMVAIGLGIIGTYAILYNGYVDIFLLVMAGAFLGFPIGYYIEHGLNDPQELGDTVELANLQD